MQKHDNELQNILIQHEQCIHDVELKLKEMYTIHNKLKNIMTKSTNEENDEIGSDESDDVIAFQVNTGTMIVIIIVSRIQ